MSLKHCIKNKSFILALFIILMIVLVASYYFRPKLINTINGSNLSVESLQRCKDINFCGWKNMNIKMTGYLVKMDSTNYVIFDEPYKNSIDYGGLHIEYFEGYNNYLDKLKKP